MSAPPLLRHVDERRVSVVRDAAAVRRVLDEDPVGSCMVASRVAEHGIEPSAIGGELWTRRRASESLCYAGANLIPLRGDLADLNAFADKAMSSARRCSSLVGRAEFVIGMWRRLEHTWGPARDVREHQPLMALSTAPQSPIDPAVRPVRVDELDAYLVAAIDMFIGEVGIDPRVGDGGRGYRRRVAGLIAAGRAWARFERGQGRGESGTAGGGHDDEVDLGVAYRLIDRSGRLRPRRRCARRPRQLHSHGPPLPGRQSQRSCAPGRRPIRRRCRGGGGHVVGRPIARGRGSGRRRGSRCQQVLSRPSHCLPASRCTPGRRLPS